MRAKTVVAIGFAACLISLVVTVPVSLVSPRVDGWTRGAVTLLQPTGSVLGGSASVRLRLPGAAPITIDRVEWDWHALALLRGRVALGLRMTTDGVSGSLTLGRSPGAWHVQEATLQGPASALSALYPSLGTWSPSGRIELTAPDLRVDGAGFTGTASVHWRDAGLSLSAVQPLGTWRLTLAGQGGPANLSLTTSSGPLSLMGNGTVDMQGKATFTGMAKAEAGREADLEPVLVRIGPRGDDGTHAFRFP